MLGYLKIELNLKVCIELILMFHSVNLLVTKIVYHVPLSEIVHKDLKSTLRILYSIFGKYKTHFQQQPHPPPLELL